MSSGSHFTTGRVGSKQEVPEDSKGLDLVFPSPEMGTPVGGAGGQLGEGGRHLMCTDGVQVRPEAPGLCTWHPD